MVPREDMKNMFGVLWTAKHNDGRVGKDRTILEENFNLGICGPCKKKNSLAEYHTDYQKLLLLSIMSSAIWSKLEL